MLNILNNPELGKTKVGGKGSDISKRERIMMDGETFCQIQQKRRLNSLKV